MRRPSILLGALLGGASAVLVILVSYLGNQLARLSFVPFDIFDWMARFLPGFIVNFGVDSIVAVISALHIGPIAGVAKLAEQSIAVLQFVVLGVVFGAVLAWLSRRDPGRWRLYGVLGGVVMLVGTGFIQKSLGFTHVGPEIDLLWLAILFLGWGVLLAALLRPRQPVTRARPEGQTLNRRAFLRLLWLVGVGAAVGTVGAALYFELRQRPVTARTRGGTPVPLRLGPTSGPAASPGQVELDSRIDPAPGTRDEYTPTPSFYRVDINTTPPQVEVGTWRLQVGGLVDRPLNLTLDDVRSRPSISQVITLSCISNPIGGDLISTSRWTGVPFKDILTEAGVKVNAGYINIQSVDGFYESLSLQDAMDERTLLVYEMDGSPLTADHGFPLRVYIPDRYGMKQPKWISKITLVDREGPGYWVDRGWSRSAIANTTSVIDTVATGSVNAARNTVPVGGIAWAGGRGISKVEVQVDGGPWTEAQLRVPPLSPLTWVQWRYDFPRQSGEHTFKVRAYDGAGTLQVLEEHDTFPNGATGVHSFMAQL